MSNWTKALGFGALGFALLQLLPVDRSAPPDQDPLEIADAAVVDIVGRACADCHTNHTDWPWYGRVAPMSWWLARHVREGRDELNLSTWGALDDRSRARAFDEIAEVVQEGEMPLPSYTWGHAGARLTDDERATVADWARARLDEVMAAPEQDAVDRP